MFLNAPPPQIHFSKERNMRLVIRRIWLDLPEKHQWSLLCSKTHSGLFYREVKRWCMGWILWMGSGSVMIKLTIPESARSTWLKTPLTNWTNVFTVLLLILKSLTLVIKVLIFFLHEPLFIIKFIRIHKIFFILIVQ